MNHERMIGQANVPRRAVVWLRRWQVEEEGLLVRLGDTVAWQCLRPSPETAAAAAAANVVLTAEIDTYADATDGSAIHPVQGEVEDIREVRTDGRQTALVSCNAISPKDVMDLSDAPGFVITVRLRSSPAIDLPAASR